MHVGGEERGLRVSPLERHGVNETCAFSASREKRYIVQEQDIRGVIADIGGGGQTEVISTSRSNDESNGTRTRTGWRPTDMRSTCTAPLHETRFQTKKRIDKRGRTKLQHA